MLIRVTLVPIFALKDILLLYICNIPVIGKLCIARGHLNFHSTNFEYYEANKCAPAYLTKCLHGLKSVYNCEYGYFSSCIKRLLIFYVIFSITYALPESRLPVSTLYIQ